MRYLLPLLVLAAWLGGLLPAQAEEFKSPKGFSLTVPEGWQAASAEQLKKIAEGTKKATGIAPDYAAMIIGPRSDDFSANINVIVIPAKIVLDEKSEKEVATAMQRQFANGGKGPEVKPGHITIDGKKAFTMALERTEPTSGKVIRQWIVMLPGKQQAYTINCTALKSQWNDVWEGIHDLVLSFKADLGN
jgi:hypothetical protein